MTSHEEAIDLLRKGSLLLCVLCEEIGAEPDDVEATVAALKNGKPAKKIGTLNVGDIVRRMHALIDRHERTALHPEGTVQ